MVVVLGILAALFLLAIPGAFALGVATGRLAREKMRAEIDTLNKQLARQRGPKPTFAVSVSQGIPAGMYFNPTHSTVVERSDDDLLASVSDADALN